MSFLFLFYICLCVSGNTRTTTTATTTRESGWRQQNKDKDKEKKESMWRWSKKWSWRGPWDFLSFVFYKWDAKGKVHNVRSQSQSQDKETQKRRRIARLNINYAITFSSRRFLKLFFPRHPNSKHRQPTANKRHEALHFCHIFDSHLCNFAHYNQQPALLLSSNDLHFSILHLARLSTLESRIFWVLALPFPLFYFAHLSCTMYN